VIGIAGQAYETLLVEQLDRVVRLTMNRPDRRNALSQTLQAELVSAVEACASDESVHAVIIRGAGKSFSSGYDIGPSEGADPAAAPQVSYPRRAIATIDIARRWSRIWDAPIPVLAQVHGHCLAGGTDLALHCDLVIAAEDATIGFPALRMGGTPPANMWLYHVGAQWAKRLLFTGDTITGRMAERIGFALEAVPADRLDEHVLALARRIAAMGRDIVALNKHVLNRGVDMMGRSALEEFGASLDALANQAAEMAAFQARVQEVGLAAAFKERDKPFAEGVPIDVRPSR
jgi:enoyl-CoA hydratase